MNPATSTPNSTFVSRFVHGWIAAVCGLLIQSTLFVQAEGLRNPPPGAFGLSRAGGKIAHVDNASALHHNPANVVDIEGFSAAVAPNFVYIAAEFQSAGGMTAETKDPWKVLPNFFVTMPLKNDRYSVGLSIVTPYGVSNEWERNGAYGAGGVLRYASPYFTELKTINLQPTLSARINEQLSAGVGFNAMWSEVDFRQYFPWFAIPGGVGEGEMRARAQGTGFGATAGLTYRVNDRHTIAATVRTPISIRYDGKFSVTNPQFGTADRSRLGTHIKFPTIVGIGYGFKVNDKVRIAADFEWLEWSNFNQLPLNVGSAPPGLPSGLNQSWSNGFTAGVAGDWKFAENWTASLGYQFYDSPIGDYSFSNSIPGSNQNVVTLGLGYQRGRHRVEAAFSEVFYDERNITSNQNPALLGTHQTTVHLLALTYQIGF